MGKFWIYISTIGAIALIVVKSVIVVPEEVLQNPTLITIFSVSVLALSERAKQIWDERNRLLKHGLYGRNREDVVPPELPSVGD